MSTFMMYVNIAFTIDLLRCRGPIGPTKVQNGNFIQLCYEYACSLLMYHMVVSHMLLITPSVHVL